MSDFGNREAHEQALETLKKTHGEQALGPHKGGYLSQDEYATKIYYWAGEEHDSEEIEGVIQTLANVSWALGEGKQLPVAGTVRAFEELYRDKAVAWRLAYRELFRRVEWALNQDAGQPGWNDFHIAQWFILRRARRDDGVEIIDKLLDRVAEGGSVGYDAKRAMNICAVQCKPFQIAVQKAQEERMQRMVIQ